jgi:hypothetical protein
MSIGRLPAGLHEFGGIRDQCSPRRSSARRAALGVRRLMSEVGLPLLVSQNLLFAGKRHRHGWANESNITAKLRFLQNCLKPCTEVNLFDKHRKCQS